MESWTIVIVLGIILLAIVAVVLVGALALWVLQFFFDVEWNWWLALGLGIIIGVIGGGGYSRSSS